MAVKPNTPKDYKENIENYIDEFRSYKTFSEAVRHLPGMYIGAIGNIGWKACIREIFQNATDEMIKAESPCNYVYFEFDENTQSAIIRDNGRGIPHGHIIEIYTSAHMSTNFEETKKLYEYSSGTHGVGGGVAMALSEQMIIESCVLGKCHRVEFNRGNPWNKGEIEEKKAPFEQGTQIYLKPDAEIIGTTNLTCEEIYETLVLKIFYLTPPNSIIEFVGHKFDGQKIHTKLTNTQGIVGALAAKVSKPLIKPIVYGNDTGRMRCNIAFTYDPSDLNDREDIDGYANYTPCEGVNVQGFISGLTSYFMAYMNKIYLKNNNKITVNASDIKTGLKAVVEVAHLTPIFSGQGKTSIDNQDLFKFTVDLTKKSLDDWCKVNPTELNKLCKFFKDVAEIRQKLESGKTKLSSNYTKSSISGYPKKYLAATGKKGTELFITEGDSAFGSARKSRNHVTDAVYPIRGKIINCFSHSKAEVFKNEEVAAINKIITKLDYYDPNFDADKSPFSKIIFMADADPDGGHIRTLLLRLFLMYYPDFIRKGKVYAAVPPLYGLAQGKKMVYFTDSVDLAKYSQVVFNKKYIIEDKDTKKRLTPNEIVKLFALNTDYIATLDMASSLCAVTPKVLEDVLIQIADDIEITVRKSHSIAMAQARFSMSSIDPATLHGMINNGIEFSLKKLDINALKKRIEKKYRFMEVNIINRHLVISGLAGDKTQNIVLDNRFIENCYPAIKIISKNQRMYFRVNGELKSLYEVMHLVENLIPNLTRYKGLGEQDPKQLYESTMDPTTRTLIQYTMQSAKEEIQTIKIIDDDRSAILRGIQITRQDIE